MYALLLAASVGAPADAPNFIAISPSDERPTGKLNALRRDFSAILTTPDGEVTVADVVSLRRTDRPLPPLPTGPHLITTAGDRIAGTVAGGDDQSLRFLPSGIWVKQQKAWKVPLSSANAVWLTDTPADTSPDPARYDWLAENKNRDVLRLRNGDTIRGSLESLEVEGGKPIVSFRPEQGDARSIPARELAAIGFNPALARTRKSKGAYARVVLADGSRIHLTNVAISNDVLMGETLFGQKFDCQLASVISLDVLQGKAAYLSDLKPRKVEQGGFLGVVWPWSADRSVHGTALKIATADGESTADKGLGTHPRTVLTYDLARKYRRFEALVGIDPAGAVAAKVTIRVLVDGKELAIPGLGALKAGHAVMVRVDLRGAKELVLVTDFGPAGGVGADVNWADARLVE